MKRFLRDYLQVLFGVLLAAVVFYAAGTLYGTVLQSVQPSVRSM